MWGILRIVRQYDRRSLGMFAHVEYGIWRVCLVGSIEALPSLLLSLYLGF